METKNAYIVLSKIYRQIAEQRQHFQKQHQVLKLLFKMHAFLKSAKILDAACGTGDVAIMLCSEGYMNMHAVDASHHMLSHWPKKKGDILRKQIEWDKLECIFQDWGKFDFIYFLGHSLPHLPVAKLPLVFRSVFKGLSKGGVLAFDIRPWIRLHNGSLTQLGREERVTRLIGTFRIDQRPYWLFEEVYYKNTVQEVKYRLVPQFANGKDLKDTLTYHLYRWEDARKLLIEAGFSEKAVKILELPEWPYLVITAKKGE